MNLAELIIPPIVAFILTFISTKWIIGIAKSRGFLGKDVNKPDKPEVAQLGGVGIVTGFVAGAFTLLLLDGNYTHVIIPVLLSSLLIAYLGLLDDVLNLRQSIRAILPAFASVPLIIYSSGHSTISIPFIGPINFGIFFYVIIIPASLTIASNAFNMLEGLNGLGAGMGAIMSLALFIASIKSGGFTIVAGYLALILAVSLIAFLYYNKYPAKVFIGNIGTYFVGSVIGSIGIAGYMYTALFILYLPYVLEFILKARTKFKGVSFGKVEEDGTLSWDGKPQSLTHIIMKRGRFKEYQIVAIIWLIEVIFAILAVYLQTTIIVLR
ncbi:MAG: UDP-N-acetylglucosamine--dolichyl-phosphate N-acetylglucosaminephosphotransferase [Sulfolobaceae archaeon]|nr:UDP-N-acetylglucosamine--dolichyl-phosphate N-acetylglucosaminephosphotransferase [Sulfolobaceae archaeon]